ncbi:aspartyl-tRNA(Asn)/glutamyl-tRNA(Gln) amidotransferase subunit A [Nonomuraea polychroma]|uniref:Aspartyl-tRNA(Asn)/glutamyl-tRNA(Gln) amidotransferase subunit A n=1 Tax=Nonomuraea polychroma TaxID=46176 RepID=A0A438LZ25_9ACTN|nr:amidase [Nonomuraea polychroma]RVX38789.1 aspartyl-tRNA(Asn)/glutamyl-tRNA(Gln) amidotransferase subunit A [Nonomuraea polychroma]
MTADQPPGHGSASPWSATLEHAVARLRSVRLPDTQPDAGDRGDRGIGVEGSAGREPVGGIRAGGGAGRWQVHGDETDGPAGLWGPGGVDELGARLRSGAVTAVELVEAALAAAEADASGAFVALLPDRAIAAARRADAERRRGLVRGPLHGVPVAVKDNIDVAGVATRNGTAGLGHRVPVRDAAVVRLLEEAGAVVIGKTRMHELAWGMMTPGCRNPRDLSRSAGGSSGGSAAAVASGIVEISLGTDTGGSIRNPAALCGVAGLRPTWGSLPMTGITPLAPTQDTVGPIARSAADCAAVFAVLTGALAHRPPETVTASPAPGPPALPGRRVAMPDGLWRGRVGEGIADRMAAARGALLDAGAEVVEVDLPGVIAAAPAVTLVVMLAESAELWADAPGAASAELRATLQAGAEVRATDYVRARRVAAHLRDLVTASLRSAGADLLLLPTVPVTAAPAGADTVEVSGRLEATGAAFARLTALASVTGLPALSVPAGTDATGLPVGAQLVGPPRTEMLLCAAGAVIAGLASSD